MGISISEVLAHDILGDTKILAGKDGLTNIVENVSVIEMPVVLEKIIETQEHDFYISGLYAYKDRPEEILDMLEQLKKEGCSGLGVSDAFFTDFSDEIKDFCNENKLPLILFSESVPYAFIISRIFQEIIRQKDEIYFENMIETFVLSEKSEIETRKMAKMLNNSFREYYFVLYFTNISKPTKVAVDIFKEKIGFQPHWLMSKYREGYLLIITFDNIIEINEKELIGKILKVINKTIAQYQVGISDLYKNIGTLNNCINEALIAHASSKSMKKSIVYYKNLGVYKLLFQLKSDTRLRKFRDEIMTPLIEYEKKNNVQLIETAQQYIINDGDLKKTAEKLFLHINTVRYRLNKIKEILGLQERNIMFYVQLSLAIKADEILENY